MVMRLLAAAALALPTAQAFAQDVSRGDKVYDVHSEAQGSCPSLNWHIVASPDGVLTGMIAWDNMEVMASVSGTMNEPPQIERHPKARPPQDRTFNMIATERGGQHRQANITGTIRRDGWLIADIQGSGVACQSVKLRWYSPAAPR